MNLIRKLLNDNLKNGNAVTADRLDLNDFIIQFTNCRILRSNTIYTDDLWIRNGKVLDPEKVFFDEKRQSDLQIDCDNRVLAPGFIDTQINGAFGHDFTSDWVNISENLKIVSKGLLQYGVTAYCPTVISSDKDTYEKVLRHIQPTKGGSDGAAILGAHLEGPFISKEKFGAHCVKHLRTLNNNVDELHNVYGKALGNVRIITLAPELDPTGLITKYLASLGIIVSIGHSAASLPIAEKSVEHGARFITHLFNAMLPFHHRDPHIFGLLSDRSLADHLYYGIIADGIHTHPSALNIAYKTHPSGLILVTDAISAMGLCTGVVHSIGDQDIEIKENDGQTTKRAVIAHTNTLCGSIATFNECVKIFGDATGCSLTEALKCGSEHPAKLLGIYPRKGSLSYGSDADFIIIDEDINVKSTFISGDLVWSNDSWTPKYKFKDWQN